MIVVILKFYYCYCYYCSIHIYMRPIFFGYSPDEVFWRRRNWSNKEIRRNLNIVEERRDKIIIFVGFMIAKIFMVRASLNQTFILSLKNFVKRISQRFSPSWIARCCVVAVNNIRTWIKESLMAFMVSNETLYKYFIPV